MPVEWERPEKLGSLVSLSIQLELFPVPSGPRPGARLRAAPGVNNKSPCSQATRAAVPRQCAAPLRGIAPIATLKRLVVHCSCELDKRNSLSNSQRPSLHWRGLVFIARASRLYRPRPRARPRGHGELLKLLRLSTFAACCESWPVMARGISAGHEP